MVPYSAHKTRLRSCPSTARKEGRKHRFRHICQTIGLAGVLCLVLGQTDQALGDFDAAPPSSTLSLKQVNLCDWQYDYRFFTKDKPVTKSEAAIPCEGAFDFDGATSDPAIHMTAQEGDGAAFEAELRSIVAGYPIEVMVPVIAGYDREIAGLIIGIGKKESNWGKRAPRTDAGEDCFNYWGYKGAGARGMAMGHGCFGEPAEAVRAIADRLQELVALRKTSDPQYLTIWKCGSSCATHSVESVRKWVTDVDLYYQKIAKK